MTGSSEFWQLLIYCSDTARGSPTGVVFPGDDLSPSQYQAVAAALGYPDTVFLTSGCSNSEWSARSFSPAQELSLCTQALIAAFRVLQRRGSMPSITRILFRTPSGLITVSEAERKEIAWLTGPCRILDRRISPSPLARMVMLAPAEEVVIDTGRIRLFCELPQEEQLRAVTLEPVHVMSYCAAEKIDGICLFARTGEREIRMRVFTTSLDGKEDISTGGAVLGLLPYLQRKDSQPPAGCWTIQQGIGSSHQRGTLFTTPHSEPGMAVVGGAHRFVAKGILL
ncbi:MAG: PhzF family phenazine biosynthesis isomerase [Terriglobales bacterium]